MTQPAVTRVIQEIEQYYGVRLFERFNRRLSVTESGKMLYAQALHIVDSFDTVEKGLRNWDTFGILRIGASITLGNYFLPEFICHFRSLHPNIRVEVTVSNGGNLQQALLENKLDLALIEGGISESGLIMEAFTGDCLKLILPPQHPLLSKQQVFLNDLVQYDFLLREKDSAGRTFLDNVFAIHGLKVRPLWESASTQVIIKAVSQGIGISILPEILVQQDIASQTVFTREITDESFNRKHYIVWHKNKYLTQAAKDLIALCKESALKSPAL
ncbi:DNA-binding transcriptional LysR family regulator [Mobilisporobacter senegalensis]|uniref:DNA-binding transcriptional LysR family regulator n=2 Tax=Mobilisporobacter senegalensis TaxID=1329262 RepID=A0A3N1XUU0_9FIRM|nr:DNA-binding transcriptional LysR family regulator [Mobilisporobacter senegalensis]